ncbi:DUF222 domain-containing protein [Pseudonocardia sp. C8]|uniref:HNH endonuclease signature motif containing protein n=1 Tax=Pseudonocardia sp. C8 TaxID=2762759 RepID=UPI00164338F1|nr:HNH endonuclease signature motif containing protein [Pseudonocardia sp. C8]MBC3192577.1 DUF222 domain-containing protein [Pseudonocardia sp. C8]
MPVEQVVPEGLAGLPVGPGLAAALAGLDLARVPNDDIVDVLLAQSRQLAHEQARMLAALAEVVYRRPFAGPGQIHRGETPEPYAADEVRAALAWTRRAAEAETDLAVALVHDLPQVWTALDQGRIDRGKATVFATHLAGLPTTLRERVCTEVLPHAPRLTTGQIAERIKRLILEADPAYFEQRYRRAIRERQVVAYLAEDGTAVLTATGLPADEAAAAWERLDTLARAARHDGHPGTLDQVRADLVLGLLDGSLHGLSRAEILHALLERFAGHPDTPDTPASPDGATGSSPTPTAPGSASAQPGAAESDGTDSSSPGSGGPDSGDPDPARPNRRRRRGVGVEVRVPLSTLLGLDQRPGEIPGWGPIPADAARRIVARQHRAQWRWVIVDTDGHLLAEGLTRRRPTTGIRRRDRDRTDEHDHKDDGPAGGIVEIHIPETLLTELAADAAHPRWARVIADITARYQHHRQQAAPGADLDAHPTARFPRAALRRHTQVRDRTCTFPTCRTPARRCDQDHTTDHTHGGPTTRDDLGPLCRHDHTLKTEAGWDLDQPEPGRFIWTSPLGKTYPVAPEPILPPPMPPLPPDNDPGGEPPDADTGQHDLDLHRRHRAPPQDDTPPDDTAAGGPHDDPTPF